MYCNVLVEELVGLILLDLSGQAYKRVGAMVHNADIGRGIIGVMDVTDIMVYSHSSIWQIAVNATLPLLKSYSFSGLICIHDCDSKKVFQRF